MLKAPDFNRPFDLQTDASEYGFGAMLLQKDENGDIDTVSFISRNLHELIL